MADSKFFTVMLATAGIATVSLFIAVGISTATAEKNPAITGQIGWSNFLPYNCNAGDEWSCQQAMNFVVKKEEKVAVIAPILRGTIAPTTRANSCQVVIRASLGVDIYDNPCKPASEAIILPSPEAKRERHKKMRAKWAKEKQLALEAKYPPQTVVPTPRPSDLQIRLAKNKKPPVKKVVKKQKQAKPHRPHKRAVVKARAKTPCPTCTNPNNWVLIKN